MKPISLLDVDAPAGLVTLPDPKNPAKRGRDVNVRRASVGVYQVALRMAQGEGRQEDIDVLLAGVIPDATPEERATLTQPQIEIVASISVRGAEAILKEITEGNGEAPKARARSSKRATGSPTSSRR